MRRDGGPPSRHGDTNLQHAETDISEHFERDEDEADGRNEETSADAPIVRRNTTLEINQKLRAHDVRLVARKASIGLFIYGSGGTGKGRTVLAVLRDEGIEPVFIDSHIMPLARYSTFNLYRDDHVVLLEDADATYSSLPRLSILLSALHWNPDRIVTYNSSMLPQTCRRVTPSPAA